MAEHSTFVYLYNTSAGTSHSLLFACARDYCYRVGKKDVDLSLDKHSGGKPYFKNMSDVHFSISHSGKYWLCAFSSCEIGADIQMFRRINAPLVARAMYKLREMELARNDLSVFFDIWCAKEAYLKYTGRGFNFLRSNVDVAGADGVKNEIDGVRLEKIPLPFVDCCARICGGEGQVQVLDHTFG